MGVGNPWHRLPDEPEYLLEIDREAVERHNRRFALTHDHRIRLEVIPEPFTGRTDAPVVLLNLNPGFGESDIADYNVPHRREMMRFALTHELAEDQAFWHLTPEFSGTGAWDWWKAKLNPLIQEVGMEAVRRGVQVIEYFPYKSRKYRDLGELLPSQQYSFELARRAVQRDALIVVMRAYKRWIAAVDDLEGADVHQLRNKQNVTIGPGNAVTSFNEIVTRLR